MTAAIVRRLRRPWQNHAKRIVQCQFIIFGFVMHLTFISMEAVDDVHEGSKVKSYLIGFDLRCDIFALFPFYLEAMNCDRKSNYRP